MLAGLNSNRKKDQLEQGYTGEKKNDTPQLRTTQQASSRRTMHDIMYDTIPNVVQKGRTECPGKAKQATTAAEGGSVVPGIK